MMRARRPEVVVQMSPLTGLAGAVPCGTLKPAEAVTEGMVLILPFWSMATKFVSEAWSCRVRMLPVPACWMKSAGPVELDVIVTLPVRAGEAMLAVPEMSAATRNEEGFELSG